jgi:splicing factor 3A subunit 1
MASTSGGVQSGRVVGFIRPPPDVRAIVDKTAQFVAKAGSDFEGRIAEREAGNLKFAFLRPDNPYHAYYRHKVDELASGKASAAPAPAARDEHEAGASDDGAPPPHPAPVEDAAPAPIASSATPSVHRAAVANPLMSALKAARELLAAGTPPPKDEFTIPTPSYGVGELVDTIKLTAQYTAVNGRGFLASLTSREMRNPLFDFLKPTHALFAYFTALVNAYVRVLQVRAASTLGGGVVALVGRPVVEPVHMYCTRITNLTRTSSSLIHDRVSHAQTRTHPLGHCSDRLR